MDKSYKPTKLFKESKAQYDKLSIELKQHSNRVVSYAELLFLRIIEMNVFPDEKELSIDNINLFKQAVLFHDIGKASLPDEIIINENKLTEAQKIISEEHPNLAIAFIEKDMEYPLNTKEANKVLSMAIDIASNHHENWDGSGYPNRWSGEMIPLTARIVSLVNFYDNVTGRKNIVGGTTHRFACMEISKLASIYFDPTIVSVFMHYQNDFENIYKVFFNPTKKDTAKKDEIKKKPTTIKWPLELNINGIYETTDLTPAYLDTKLIIIDKSLGYVDQKLYWDVAIKSSRAFKLLKTESELIGNNYKRLKAFPPHIKYIIKTPRVIFLESNINKFKHYFDKYEISNERICLDFNKDDGLTKDDIDLAKANGFKVLYTVNESISEVFQFLSIYQIDMIRLNYNLIFPSDINERQLAVLKSLIALCQELQIEIIMDEIPNKNDIVKLKEMHVNYVGGSQISKSRKKITSQYLTAKIKIGGRSNGRSSRKPKQRAPKQSTSTN